MMTTINFLLTLTSLLYLLLMHKKVSLLEQKVTEIILRKDDSDYNFTRSELNNRLQHLQRMKFSSMSNKILEQRQNQKKEVK